MDSICSIVDTFSSTKLRNTEVRRGFRCGIKIRRLLDPLLPFVVLDPELTWVGADAVACALVQFPRFAVAGSIYGETDRGRDAIQDQYRQCWHDNYLAEAAARELAPVLGSSQVKLPPIV